MSDEILVADTLQRSADRQAGTLEHPREQWESEVRLIAPPRLGDLWSDLRSVPFYLPLFKVLVWRAISLRYAQSYFGLLWVVVQPIATTIIVFFMFGIIRAKTSDGSNQGLFLFSGIMTWQLFARGLTDVNNSLLSHAGILTKIYLPKVILPFAMTVATWFDTLIMIILLILVCVLLGSPLSERVLLLPVFLFLVSLAGLAVGLGLAPVNALFRDIGVVLPLLLQFGMYASPVFYAASFIPDRWTTLYHLNPMASLIEGVRWSVLPESPAPDLTFLTINILSIVLMLTISIVVFKKLESIVIDRI